MSVKSVQFPEGSALLSAVPVRARRNSAALAAMADSCVKNRGVPPPSFLRELVAWGKSAPPDIFEPNAVRDIYSSVYPVLGPYTDAIHRRAVMLEVMRVLAGFESSWDWNCGRDTANPDSDTDEEIEAGAWQVSFDSRAFGADLQRISPDRPKEFQRQMKRNHALAMEYIARLLRHTTKHNGPVKRGEIHPWLQRRAVDEFAALLQR